MAHSAVMLTSDKRAPVLLMTVVEQTDARKVAPRTSRPGLHLGRHIGEQSLAASWYECTQVWPVADVRQSSRGDADGSSVGNSTEDDFQDCQVTTHSQ